MLDLPDVFLRSGGPFFLRRDSSPTLSQIPLAEPATVYGAKNASFQIGEKTLPARSSLDARLEHAAALFSGAHHHAIGLTPLFFFYGW